MVGILPDWRVCAALNIIPQRYREADLALSTAAVEMRTTSRHLGHLVRQECGVSFSKIALSQEDGGRRRLSCAIVPSP